MVSNKSWHLRRQMRSCTNVGHSCKTHFIGYIGMHETHTAEPTFEFFQVSYGVFTLAWSRTGTGIMQNLSHCTWTGKNGLCMVLIRTFHTAPEQGQGRTLVFITGNIFRTWKIGTRPILQVLKMFLVFFPVPVQVQCERFLLKPHNPFFLVPVPVPDQASVNTPLVPKEWEYPKRMTDKWVLLCNITNYLARFK